METTKQRTPHFKPVEELMYVYKVGHGCPIIAKLRIFGRKFLKTSKLQDVILMSDDFMFGYVMRNPEICKELLERLLKIKIEKLEYPELQKSISPYYEAKGVRLDVYVKDSDKVFDIEIQNGKKSNLGKRTRYYQSMISVLQYLKNRNKGESRV